MYSICALCFDSFFGRWQRWKDKMHQECTLTFDTFDGLPTKTNYRDISPNETIAQALKSKSCKQIQNSFGGYEVGLCDAFFCLGNKRHELPMCDTLTASALSFSTDAWLRLDSTSPTELIRKVSKQKGYSKGPASSCKSYTHSSQLLYVLWNALGKVSWNRMHSSCSSLERITSRQTKYSIFCWVYQSAAKLGLADSSAFVWRCFHQTLLYRASGWNLGFFCCRPVTLGSFFAWHFFGIQVSCRTKDGTGCRKEFCDWGRCLFPCDFSRCSNLARRADAKGGWMLKLFSWRQKLQLYEV